VMLRFDPGFGRVRNARSFQVWEGGGEYNVARAMRKCWQKRAAVVTALPKNDLGWLVEDFIMQGGVDMSHVIWRDFDGLGRNTRVGLNFTEKGFGIRPALGCSDRGHSAASQIKPGEVNWEKLFGEEGVRWFHTGGIFAALSPSAAELIVEAMDAARGAGAVVSFDVNFRPGLWHAHGGPAKAAPVLRRIVERVDVLLSGEADIQALLGVEGPEPAKGFAPGDRHNPHSRSLDATAFFSTAAAAARAYPRLRVVASPRRQVLSASRHRWSAVAWVGGEEVRAPELDLDVYDRVGTGDALAAGLFAGLLGGESPEAALRLGWAHGALVSTFPGDTTMATLDEVRALAAGESATIQR